MNRFIRPLLSVFALLSLLTGLAYPLVVTGLSKALFPAQASGSLVLRDGKPVGSALIGQVFSDPGHFWGRPSATSPMGANASASSGSNLGPLNPALVDVVTQRVKALRDAARVARVRKLPLERVNALVAANTESPWLGFFGEARVNVLQLNLALDSLH